jgi:hypothetical protein
MSKNEPMHRVENCEDKTQALGSKPQQDSPLPSELRQQISALNMRVNNATCGYNDLLREMERTIKAMAFTLIALEKENAELKSKAANM